ncbi:RHS repeat-associated core domain-containing protein [Corallococcus carmarthensis]|uniref:RHS repeat-associated core domain-containing protein n=1 Tax=Corallococcus carmarthensis TaxID=2316728 RepID=UPI0026488D69|nr:RHS repeat-associated core domain-containing protein [Corallococcus carmarthensis]
MNRVLVVTCSLIAAAIACGPANDGLEHGPAAVGTSSARVVTLPANTLVPTEKEPNGLAVGLSRGVSSVGPDGSASYAIPLWAPEGRAGLKPMLAISYKSNGGSTLLGQGWSLDGLSEITRCRRTQAQDGRVEVITFSDADAFCLDGQRLVAVQGVYGATGTEYRTERESFMKIVSLEADASGPAMFRVYLKDGKVLTYGKLNGATLSGERTSVHPSSFTDYSVLKDGQQNRLSWALAQVEDRSGNFMSFLYTTTQDPSDSGYERKLSRIRYTGSTSGTGLAPNRFIDFAYEPRPDGQRHYTAGFLVKSTQRLKEIQVSGPNPINTGRVRTYRLTYLPTTLNRISRLASFQECDGQDVCMAPITFTWTPESDLFEDVNTGITDVAGSIPSLFTTLMAMDVDADGFDDLLYRVQAGQAYRYKWVVRYGSASGFAPPTDASYLPNVCYDIKPGHNGRWADVNFDGLPDVSLLQLNACTGPGLYSELKHFRKTNAPGGRAANSFLEVGNDGKWGSTFWYVDFDADAYPELVGVNWLTNSLGYRPNVGGTLQPFQSIQTPAKNDNSQFALNLDGSGKTSLLYIEKQQLSEGGPFVEVGKRYWSMTQRASDHLFVKQETTLIRSDVDFLPNGTLFDYGPEGEDICENCYRWQYLFADLTGDGLPEAIRAKEAVGGDVEILVNTGNGFAPPVLAPLSQTFKLSPFTQDNGIRLVDFNGDGLQDLLLMDGGSGTRTNVALLQSTGSGFITRSLAVPIGQQGNAGANLSQTLDANGDGLADLVQVVNGTLHVYLRKSPPAGLLTAIVDSLGARTEFSYKPMIDPSVYTPGTGCTYPQVCMKKGLWLVSEHRLDAGDTPMRTLKYTYKDARMDVLGRGWLGFAAVTMQDVAGSTETRTEFDNRTRQGTRYPFANMPALESKRTTLQGRVRIQTRSTQYDTQVQGSPQVNARWSIFPKVVSEDVYDRAGTAPEGSGLMAHAETHFIFDTAYGNLLNQKQTHSNGDQMEWTTTFENDPSSWLVGLSKTVEQKSTIQGNEVVRRYAYEYQPGTALLKKDFIEPGDPVFEVVLEYFRAADGLVFQIKKTGAGMLPRSTSFTYDPLDRIHPANMTNAKGHTVSYAYHPSLGVPGVKVDENGIVTGWQYDGFGRVRKMDAPDASDITLTYVSCQTTSECMLQVRSQITQGQEERTNIDRLGRTLSVSRRAFNDSNSWITRRSEFDALGRLWKQWEPSPTGWKEVSTTFSYDALGRPLETRYPDGSHVSWAYESNKITRFDEKNNRQVTLLDLYGRTTTVKDSIAGRELVTQLGYGPFGILAFINNGNAVGPSFKYDRQGRRVEVNDPDSGLSIYQYNALGELTETQDGNGDHTIYERDLLGRVITETNRDGVSRFTWDTVTAPGAAETGRLHKTIQEGTANPAASAVSTEYVYDSLGNQIASLWDVEGRQYSVERQYDAYGRLSRLTYPSVGTARFAVDYEYTAQGQLKRVRAANNGPVYWSVDGRNGLQQLTEESFGNGVVSKRRYDTRGRLLFLESTAGGQVLQRMAYAYEANGNVRSRHDPLGKTTEDFAYDSLDRLTSWTVFQNCQTGTANYQYDDLGNLTSRQGLGESLALFYEGTAGAGPHAVSRSSLGTYSYDGNGNQVSGPGRTVEYTTFGLPSRVVTSGQDVSFRYDALKSRVLKRASSGESTLTIEGIYEERRSASGAVTHLFNIGGDGRLVAQISWTADGVGGTLPPQTTYLHPDAQASTETLSNASGGVVERMRFEPFGGRRFPQALGTPEHRSAAGVRQGFTGHGHDDELELINMGGRIYDPTLGRFLSPDRFVAGSAPSQALNRYSYALNNPIRFTDPSGWLARELPVIVYDSWYGGYVSAVLAELAPSSSFCTTPSSMPDKDGSRGQCYEGPITLFPAEYYMSGEFARFVWRSYFANETHHNFGYGSGFFMGAWAGAMPFGGFVTPPSGNSAEFYRGYSDGMLLVGMAQMAGGLAAAAGGSGLTGGGAAMSGTVVLAPEGGAAVVGGVSIGAVGTAVAMNGVMSAIASNIALQMANQAGSGGGGDSKEKTPETQPASAPASANQAAPKNKAVGSDFEVKKVVNSNMPHASERAVERTMFPNEKAAREALQQLGRNIEDSGLPAGTVWDTKYPDRIIVPGFGEGGAVVYQVRDGTLKLKTVLEWRP